jgi:hypoxanthine phosphoribosyltransferase
MVKEFINYSDYGIMLKDLVHKIEQKNYSNIIAVYGIPRGGLPIAVHLSHYLNLDFIKSESEIIDKLKRSKNDNIIICDDVCDTGETFYKLSKELRKFTDQLIYISLYYKIHAEFNPDIYLKETNRWISFPWERNDEIPNRDRDI